MHGLRYGIFHELEVRGRSQDVEVEAFPESGQIASDFGLIDILILIGAGNNAV
jgi:hypothetical protein